LEGNRGKAAYLGVNEGFDPLQIPHLVAVGLSFLCRAHEIPLRSICQSQSVDNAQSKRVERGFRLNIQHLFRNMGTSPFLSYPQIKGSRFVCKIKKGELVKVSPRGGGNYVSSHQSVHEGSQRTDL